MAAVEITISGVLYDKLNRTTQNVVLIGEATLTGLGVGGGPIIPPPGQQPPSGAHPSHPIVMPGHPEHPIALPPQRPGEVVPPMPEAPPQTPANPVPPGAPGTPAAGWAWHPAYGWGFFPPNQAVPKK